MNLDEDAELVDEEDLANERDREVPAGPDRPTLAPDDPVTRLQRGVTSALIALPGFFEFENPISGVNATDLFNLSSLLGAAIESETVRTLNRLREIWDPENTWLGYRFERSSQAFPDVRLVRRDVGQPDIALGIELKGWFLLAKEGVPSLRYQVAPAACAPHDLICVVPWYLSNAVSGTPLVTEPWIESARYAAEWRDHWWQNIRETRSNTAIDYPLTRPYPTKAEHALARPAEDGGGNYGRLPRARPLMDDFLTRALDTEILGISAEHWLSFLKLHTDTASDEAIRIRLDGLLRARYNQVAPEAADRILLNLAEIRETLGY